MAYLYQRPAGRIEIREAHATPRGPRSRTLASFRAPLTDAHLDRAEAAARRPFDREALRHRARSLGIAVRERCADAPARELLARLRRGERLDPKLAALLRDALAARPAEPLPEALADVAEWVGANELARGRALRDLLRFYGAIAGSPDAARPAPPERFPRFRSGERRAAS
jgi:hypothetical protein